MILKTLTLENFQAHLNTTIEFNPTRNVFVGTNDANKSGIVRALGICLFNDTFALDYIHYDKKTSKLILTFDDGRAIERLRTKSKNQLVFVQPDGTRSQPFSVSGMEDEIAKFCGFYKVSLDGSKKLDNLQITETGTAHDLLLGCSYETVLKKLSNLLGTASFEQVKIELSKESNALAPELKTEEKTIEKYGNKLEYLGSTQVSETMEKIVEEIDNFKAQVKQINEKGEKLAELGSLLEKTLKLQKIVRLLEDFTEKYSESLKSAFGVEAVLVERKAKMENLRSALSRTIELQDEKYELEKEQEKLKKELDGFKCATCGKLVVCDGC